jgi:hypothetical protein
LVALVLPAAGAEEVVLQKGALRAGAARVEITPAEDAALPMSGYSGRQEGHQGVHDPLHVRVIVVDDGQSRAAVVGLDLSSIGHAFWEEMAPRIARETGIPARNILLTATHTHAGPSLGALSDDDPTTRGGRYLAEVQEKIVTAVQRAKEALQPARMGFGTGEARVNMNRRARMADGGWWLGHNPEGPSDKTVAVLKFESTAGKPLALFVNYAVHGTVLGPRNFMISGDLPGATSLIVEKHFGGDVVVPWTSAAAGDQDPIYRVGESFDAVSALGQILAEEVIRVAEGIRTSPRMSIRAAQKVIECPGKKNPPGPNRRKDLNYEFVDADPTAIRLSLLMLNHVALAGVSGEILTPIGTRLKEESPFAATMMLTHCNGSSGYLPDDASYDQISYEIVVSRVKRGCAEAAIVGGLLDMMDGL